MVRNEYQISTNKGKKMKTFKQHVKEGHKQEKYGAGQVGTTTSNSPEDSALGAHNVQDPDVLKRVNAFVGSISEREFIKPQHTQLTN